MLTKSHRVDDGRRFAAVPVGARIVVSDIHRLAFVGTTLSVPFNPLRHYRYSLYRHDQLMQRHATLPCRSRHYAGQSYLRDSWRLASLFIGIRPHQLLRPRHWAPHQWHERHSQKTQVRASADTSMSKPAAAPGITHQIVMLALPALGALALDPLLSLVDTAFVGRIGVGQLAGVGLATLILNICFSLFNFLCISITPIIAKALHSSKSTQSCASRPIAVAVWLALCLGSLTALTLLAFATPITTLLSATPDVVPFAVAYLRVRAVAIPFALASFVANGALRAFRDLRTPFMVACITNAVNIALDILLIFPLRMGVIGAAMATSVSQICAFCLMFAHLLQTRRLIFSDVVHVFRTPSLSQAKPMLSAGVLLAVRTLSILTTVAYATVGAAAMGDVSLAAFELCRQLWVFNATVLDSLATAAQALVASAMATRAVRHARSVAKHVVVMAMVAATAVAVPAVLAGSRLPGLFTASTDVQRTAAACIRAAAVCAPLNGAVFAMDGVLAACADYRYIALGIACASGAACLAIAAVRAANLQVVWLWAALNVLMVSRAMVLFARFFAKNGPMAGWRDKGAEANVSAANAISKTI